MREHAQNGLSPSNFFPRYKFPGPETAEELYRKEEYYRYKLEKKESIPTVRGDYMNHQKIVAQMMSAESPLDGILMVAAMGSGKTCSVGATLEAAKTSGKYEGGLVITQSKELEANFIHDLVHSCTVRGKYLPYNWDTIPENRRLGVMRDMLSPWYKFIDANALRGYMGRSPRRFLDSLRGHIVVMDEAHNVKPVAKKATSEGSVLEGLTKKQRQDRYKTFHAFFHGLVRCKKVLMTGTPMRNSFTEIAYLLNLLLPLSEQLPVGDEFADRFADLSAGSPASELLMSKMSGRVSFLEAAPLDMGEAFVRRTYPDTFCGEGGFPLFEDMARGIQAGVISDMIRTNAGMGFAEASKARQYESMVFPDGSYGIEGEKGYITASSASKYLQVTVGKTATEEYFATKNLVAYLRKNGNSREAMLAMVGELSCKYESILGEILAHPREKAFVFSEILNGGGLNALSALMRLLGFSRFSGGSLPSTKKRRFLLLTGSSGSGFRPLIDAFNDPRNVHGEYVQVILGSKVVAEGFTFRDVLQMHNVAAFWNYNPIDQASRRIIRLSSHDQLLQKCKEEPSGTPCPENVRMYLHAVVSATAGEATRDCKLYARAYRKDVKIKNVERLMKRSAVDCLLYYDRNRASPGHADGSRVCQYQECCYTCVGGMSLPEDIPPEERDTSTFMKYYSEDTEKAISLAVRRIVLEGLYRLSNEDFYAAVQKSMRLGSGTETETVFVDRLSFLASVSDMASRNHPLETEYGEVCYLRYRPDMWYVSLSAVSGESVDEWYTENPVFVETRSSDSALFGTLLGKTADFVSKLRSIAASDSAAIWNVGPALINSLPDSIQEILLECTSGKEKDTFGEFIDAYYSPRVYDVPGLGLVSSFLSYGGSPARGLDRVLVPGLANWRTCTSTEEATLHEYTVNFKRVRNARFADSPYGMFGVYVNVRSSIKFIDTDVYSAVRDVILSGGTPDLRTVPRGVVCGTGKYPVEKIINLIVKFGISDAQGEKLVAGLSRSRIEEDIKNKNIIRSSMLKDLSDLSEEDIRVVGSWIHSGDDMSGKMCAALLEKLSREDLVLRVIEDADIKRELLF